ncbi:MAG: WD40 repeat domain-containing protein [Candidatus Nitronauta litoralis]|uniref:WD40 repeat domain-containing protein n=1 Tax=Candidatus Nitronauta litoralis TaxID=2705533 RepID=A0A7T0BWX0_9BACT|nr:MAG: WD40 repeat domain-containing protein [Candidatus Nitronauta litoralis]
MPKLKKTSHKKNGKPLLQEWSQSIGDYVIDLSWSPDGSSLAAAETSGPITIFDSEHGNKISVASGHSFGTSQIGWSSVGENFASAGLDGLIRYWNLDDQAKEIRSMEGGSSWVENLAWHPHGKYLATSAGKYLRLWNSEGELLADWSDYESTIADIAWSPSGDCVVAATYGGLTFRFPEQPDRQRKFEWQGSSLKIAWSPDGKFIATGDQDSTIHFWDVESGQDSQMSGYPTKVLPLTWNSTSRYLATGGSNTVILWDCSGKGPQGTDPIPLEKHKELISAVAFQNNGPLLASADQSGLVAIWNNEESKKPLATVNFDSEVTQLVWAPNDESIAVGDNLGNIISMKLN